MITQKLPFMVDRGKKGLTASVLAEGIHRLFADQPI
jgi:hypothetical protein